MSLCRRSSRLAFLRMTLLATVACAAFAAFAGTAPAQEARDWPRFRGPNGSGIGTAVNLPSHWADADYNWKITLPGGGHSSPVAWGNRLFVTCCEEQAGRRMLLCVNADDGKILWRRDFDLPTTNLNHLNSSAAATPAVDADRVYVCWSSPDRLELMALDHDGKDVWAYDLGPFASQHGAGTSPIVAGGLVVLADDQDGPRSFLLALDAASGRVRWKIDRASGSTVGATPCVFQRPGEAEQIVFTSRKHGMTGVEATTGRVLWSVPDLFHDRCVGSPVPAGDLVIGTSGEGSNGKLLAAVRPGPAPRIDAGRDSAPSENQAGGGPGNVSLASVVYRMNKLTPYVPTPLVVDDLLFLWSDTGTVTCCRVKTGEVLWQEKVGGEFFCSPICVREGGTGTRAGGGAGRVYCVSKKGEVVVVSASATFKLLGRTPLGELCHSTPALAGGRMYLRTFTHLMSLGGQR